MDHWFIRLFGRGAGASLILAYSVSWYFGEEQYTWSNNTHTFVLSGLLLFGLLVALSFEINNIRNLTFKKIKEAFMGVDFFPCDYCHESICDCGDYTECNDLCGRRWCNEECAKKEGFIADEEDRQDNTCAYCRFESAEDSELLNFLLTKYKVTREKVQEEYLAEAKQNE